MVAFALVAPTVHAQDLLTGIEAKLDAYFEPLVEMGLFSGAVLVAHRDKVLVEKAYGFADIENDVANTAETSFKLMSVSKSITAIAAMRLVEDGTLVLDQPVGRYLPQWPEAWNSVTVHDLLDHSAGLPVDERIWYSAANAGKRGLAAWRHTAATLGNPPLATEPGTRHRYDNLNYELAGAVLEAASGKPYRDLITTKVFDPAGMQRSGVDDGSRRNGQAVGYFRNNGAPEPSVQDMSRIQAAGGIYSTVGDLYRLDRALRTDRFLSKASLDFMYTPKVGCYAVGWLRRPVHSRACLQHSGGANGYVADFLRFPEDNACVVVLSNFAFAPILRLSHDVAAILFGNEHVQAKLLDEGELDAYVGTYAAPQSAHRVILRRSGKLLMALDVRPGDERCGGRMLIPLGDDVFAMAFGNQRLRVRNDNLEWIESEEAAKWPRVDSGTAAWREAIGRYATAPRFAGDAWIETKDAGLLMHIPGGWPEQMKIIPVTATTAIAMYMDDGGMVMHRDGENLRWTDASGKEIRLERR